MEIGGNAAGYGGKAGRASMQKHDDRPTSAPVPPKADIRAAEQKRTAARPRPAPEVVPPR